MSVSREDILARLRRVKGPDLDSNIVDLGLVSEVLIKDGRVSFSITVPAARAHELEPLRQAAEKIVAETAGVNSVTAELAAEREPGRAAQPARGRAGALPERARAAAARARAAPPPPAPAGPRARPAPHRGRRRPALDRRCLRQGCRRQVDHRGQPGAWLAGAWSQDRHPRRRHLWAVAAAAVGSYRPAAGGARQDAAADGRLRSQGDVDGLPGGRGNAGDLAWSDGGVGADPNAARRDLGRP